MKVSCELLERICSTELHRLIRQVGEWTIICPVCLGFGLSTNPLFDVKDLYETPLFFAITTCMCSSYQNLAAWSVPLLSACHCVVAGRVWGGEGGGALCCVWLLRMAAGVKSQPAFAGRSISLPSQRALQVDLLSVLTRPGCKFGPYEMSSALKVRWQMCVYKFHGRSVSKKAGTNT